MAFQAWEETALRIIMTGFIEAGYTEQAQVTAALHRLKLEQELRALQSQATNMKAAEDVQNTAYYDAWVVMQQAIAVKQAEIDALEG